MVTNMLKDIQDAPLNSKYAKDMIKNYPKALKKKTTGKGEHIELNKLEQYDKYLSALKIDKYEDEADRYIKDLEESL